MPPKNAQQPAPKRPPPTASPPPPPLIASTGRGPATVGFVDAIHPTPSARTSDPAASTASESTAVSTIAAQAHRAQSKLQVDAFFAQPDTVKVAKVAGSLRNLSDRRREALEGGLLRAADGPSATAPGVGPSHHHSNYHRVLDVINMRRSGANNTITQSPPAVGLELGGAGAGGRASDSMVLLDAARAKGLLPAEDEPRVPVEDAEGTPGSLSRRLASFPAGPLSATRSERDVSEHLKGHLGGASAMARVKRVAKFSGVMTSVSQQAAARAHARAKQLGSTKSAARQMIERFAEAADEARDVSKRSQSATRIIASWQFLRRAYEQSRLKDGEILEWKQRATGAQPREQEQKLARRVAMLEEQCANQVGLIKGLRERLMVTRRQRDDYAAEVQALRDQVARGLLNASSPAAASSLSSSPSALSLQPRSSQRLPAASSSGGGGIMSTATAAAVPPRWHHGVEPLANISATLVLVDIQSAEALFDACPGVMPSQILLYRGVLERCLAEANGYRVDSATPREHAHMFAFNGPVSACRFAMEVQLGLLSVNWALELLDHPDMPSEALNLGKAAGGHRGGGGGSSSMPQYLWRGPRVQIGICPGGVGAKDPASGVTAFDGPESHLAALLAAMALGGEILVSGEVNAALQSSGAAGHVHEVWGVLTQSPARCSVIRILPAVLKDRLFALQRDITKSEATAIEALELAPPAISATGAAGHGVVLSSSGGPDHAATAFRAALKSGTNGGAVAILVVSLAEEAVLHRLHATGALAQSVVGDALTKFETCIEHHTRCLSGYVCRSVDGAHFTLAFPAVHTALHAALKIQQGLLEQAWSDALLAVPQFACVRTRGALMFAGLRARMGVHVVDNPRFATDALTRRMLIQGSEAQHASAFASAAFGGEILISAPVLTEVMAHSAALRHPHVASAAGIPVPVSDVLITVFQLFARDHKLRASFLNRELKLDSEPADSRTHAIPALEKELSAMQSRLEEKDKWGSHLERLVRDQSDALQCVRRDLFGLPVLKIDPAAEAAALDIPAAAGDVFLVAVTIAHIDDLMRQWAEEFTPAVDLFDQFVVAMQDQFRGTEIRRLPSGLLRVVSFATLGDAVEFWLSIARNSVHLPWSERLLDSELAGRVSSSDVFPGSAFGGGEQVVWNGLRPIAAMSQGQPYVLHNPCAGSFVALGDAINGVVELMRAALEGECLCPKPMQGPLDSLLEAATVSPCLVEGLGPCVRIVPQEFKARRKLMRNAVPWTSLPASLQGSSLPPATEVDATAAAPTAPQAADSSLTSTASQAFPVEGKADGGKVASRRCAQLLIVFVGPIACPTLNHLTNLASEADAARNARKRAAEAAAAAKGAPGAAAAADGNRVLTAAPEPADGSSWDDDAEPDDVAFGRRLRADLDRFNRTVADQAVRRGGTIMLQFESNFYIVFVHALDGLAFLVDLHVALHYESWSDELLRMPEGREVHLAGRVVLRGLRAHVGAHVCNDALSFIDAVSGNRAWTHAQMGWAYFLARHSQAGESLVSSDVHRLMTAVPPVGSQQQAPSATQRDPTVPHAADDSRKNAAAVGASAAASAKLPSPKLRGEASPAAAAPFAVANAKRLSVDIKGTLANNVQADGAALPTLVYAVAPSAALHGRFAALVGEQRQFRAEGPQTNEAVYFRMRQTYREGHRDQRDGIRRDIEYLANEKRRFAQMWGEDASFGRDDTAASIIQGDGGSAGLAAASASRRHGSAASSTGPSPYPTTRTIHSTLGRVSRALRAHLHNCRAQYVTAKGMLPLVESVSMMAEDSVLLNRLGGGDAALCEAVAVGPHPLSRGLYGPADNASEDARPPSDPGSQVPHDWLPEYREVFLHVLETSSLSRACSFDRAYAAHRILKLADSSVATSSLFSSNYAAASPAGDDGAEKQPAGDGGDNNEASSQDNLVSIVSADSVVRLHAEVERFASLVLTYASDEGRLAKQWLDTHPPLATTAASPASVATATHASIEDRLRELAAHTQAYSQATDHTVDVAAVTRSIVAHLSAVLLKQRQVRSAASSSPLPAGSGV